MKYRDMLPSDLQHVMPMYTEMMNEARKKEGFIDYPARTEKTIEEFTFWLLAILKQPDPKFKALVAIPQGRVAKGFLTAEIITRSVGEPKISAMGQMFFVDQIWRSKGVGRELIRLMWTWAREQGAEAFEACYVPNTESHKLWVEAGVRTYVAFGVFADQNWLPVLNMPELVKGRK